MKLFLMLLFTGIAISASAQTAALKKLWVSKDGLYLRMDEGLLQLESLDNKLEKFQRAAGVGFTFGDNLNCKYTLQSDTVKLDGRNTFLDDARFLIDTTRTDQLSLQPLNLTATKFVNGMVKSDTRDKLIFYPTSRLYIDTIKFEKVVFKNYGGYWAEPIMMYELDSDGKMKVLKENRAPRSAINILPSNVRYNNTPAKPKSPANEYFTVTVPKEQLMQLAGLLRISQIDQLPQVGNGSNESKIHSIELHCNQKIIFLFGTSVPFVAQDLLKYLSELPHKVTLIPSDKKLDISFTK